GPAAFCFAYFSLTLIQVSRDSISFMFSVAEESDSTETFCGAAAWPDAIVGTLATATAILRSPTS
ncbi:MAG TPA: hypothetical protein VNN08_25720, partial [Thermoanaerobaculia bacterium]|nr:hypothetical protein [Thermoanaerobaculia bacterium]